MKPRTIASTIVCAVTVVAGAALAGCAPEPAPEPAALNISDAGARYLDAVCPVNAAWNAVDLEIDRLALAADHGEPGDTRPFQGALAKVEQRSLQAAEVLADETVAWPAEAEAAVAKVAKSLEADAAQAAEVTLLSADEIVAYRWKGAAATAKSGSDTRLALGLPAEADVACEAR